MDFEALESYNITAFDSFCHFLFSALYNIQQYSIYSRKILGELNIEAVALKIILTALFY